MYEEIVLIVVILAAFWAAMLLINRRFDLKRRGLSVSPGLIMWRTQRGLNLIDRVGRARRFWRTYGVIAVVVGVFLMAFVMLNLAVNLYFDVTTPTVAASGVTLVLPGLVPGLTPLAWIVAIATVLVVHELSHGFLARAQNLKTKSVGVLVLLVIPGAFVELDEKEVSQAPLLQRLRVYSAGAFSNVVFSLVCLAVIVFLVVPLPGTYVYAVASGTPASNHNIMIGQRLYSIDNVQMTSAATFESFMTTTTPGENVVVVTSAGENTITLARNPTYENRGYLGIAAESAPSLLDFANPLFVLGAVVNQLVGASVFSPLVFRSLVPWFVITGLSWIFVLNLGIGFFNLIPAVPLDGGYMFRGMLEKVTSKENAARISIALSLVILAIILASFLTILR